MAITSVVAQKLTTEFTRAYPVADALAFYFRPSVRDLYESLDEDKASQVEKTFKGGYSGKKQIHNGREFLGRVDIVLNNARSEDDFITTLSHEVLGHYGINTFTSEDKIRLLQGISNTKDSPTLKDLWSHTEEMYSGISLLRQSEEVFAAVAQTIRPRDHDKASYNDIVVAGNKAFDLIVNKDKSVTYDSLFDVARMVAAGISLRYRKQQTFEETRLMEMKKPFHEEVADNLIKKLKEGTSPFQKPFDSSMGMPFNAVSKKRYKGINMLSLSSQDYSDPRWITYNQAKGLGAQVRRGEKGTSVQYWKFHEKVAEKDESGRLVFDANGEQVYKLLKYERPKVFFATVFNAEQIDGMPPLEAKAKIPDFEINQQAEGILERSNAHIVHKPGKAFYQPLSDKITLPPKDSFQSESAYYSVALHELGHWTGHESRLGRDLSHPFGSEAYAREELRAEISSMILGDELNVGYEIGQHVAYIDSWIKVLEDDPAEIFRAAADAEKISEYVMSFSEKLTQEYTQAPMTEQPSNENTVMTNDDAGLSSKATKIFIDVPFTEKDEAKSLGAKWDRSAQSWFVPADKDVASFSKWPTKQPAPEVVDNIKQVLSNNSTAQLTYINVPFADKDEAKEAGAKWDRQRKSWFIPPDKDFSAFSKWMSAEEDRQEVLATNNIESRDDVPGTDNHADRDNVAVGGSTNEDAVKATNASAERVYLAVAYENREEAKKAGARWDKAQKSWYADESADMAALSKFLPKNVSVEQSPSQRPEDEFLAALADLGADITGLSPIMDGSRQRIRATDDKGSEKSVFYFAYLDGRPAGFIGNNRTGEKLKWKSNGNTLSESERAKIKAEAAQKKEARDLKDIETFESTSKRLVKKMSQLSTPAEPTPYMKKKSIQVHPGVVVDKNNTTVIPAMDVSGKTWTVQYISEDGTKRFAKDGKKSGAFHPIDGLDTLKSANTIVISEGYATAATIKEVTGYASVAAFDAGNLKTVAEAIKASYPDKKLVIAGDNDKYREYTFGVNPGVEKARAAAHAVGAEIIIPVFPDQNKLYDDVKNVTPARFKAHNDNGDVLTDKELSSLSKLLSMSDFNDLAASSFGREGVERQITTLVDYKQEKSITDKLVSSEKASIIEAFSDNRIPDTINVKVGELRSSVDDMKRHFDNYSRNSVNHGEKKNWLEMSLKLLSGLEKTRCKTAKEKDIEDYADICAKVKVYHKVNFASELKSLNSSEKKNSPSVRR